MENQTNFWKSQTNNEDEPVVLNWGETSSNKPTPPPQSDNPWGMNSLQNIIPTDEKPQQSNKESKTPPVKNADEILKEKEIKTQFSKLGIVDAVSIPSELYQLNFNNQQIIKDFDGADLILRNGNNRWDFDPQPDTELGKAIAAFVSIAKSKKLRVSDPFIYKNKTGQSTLFNPETNPKYRFFYFIQGDYTSGDLQVDFSALGGPRSRFIDTCPGILGIFPGWVPINITQNNSDKELVVIIGDLV